MEAVNTTDPVSQYVCSFTMAAIEGRTPLTPWYFRTGLRGAAEQSSELLLDAMPRFHFNSEFIMFFFFCSTRRIILLVIRQYAYIVIDIAQSPLGTIIDLISASPAISASS